MKTYTDEEISKYLEKLSPLLKEKLLDIAVYMYQSLGFPWEYYEAYVLKKYVTIGDRLGFVNYFLTKHPKVGKPIHFTDFS